MTSFLDVIAMSLSPVFPEPGPYDIDGRMYVHTAVGLYVVSMYIGMFDRVQENRLTVVPPFMHALVIIYIHTLTLTLGLGVNNWTPDH